MQGSSSRYCHSLFSLVAQAPPFSYSVHTNFLDCALDISIATATATTILKAFSTIVSASEPCPSTPKIRHHAEMQVSPLPLSGNHEKNTSRTPSLTLTLLSSPVFCDYCDVYLTHDSMSVRKAHNSGRNHLRNVVDYYQQIGHEKAQSVIDSITASYTDAGQAGANPLLPQNQPMPGGGPPGSGPPGAPGFPPMPPGFNFPGGMPPPFPGMPGAPPFPLGPGMPRKYTLPLPRVAASRAKPWHRQLSEIPKGRPLLTTPVSSSSRWWPRNAALPAAW